MLLELQIKTFVFGAKADADVATLHIHPKKKNWPDWILQYD